MEHVRIFVIGAGQVGSTIVESLHAEHELTIIDLDESRLDALAYRFDVATVQGNGASRRLLQQAGVESADLLIACTSRDEPNLIAAMMTRKLAPAAKTIVRTTNIEYLEVWHERQLDVDFIVSSELETALDVSRRIGVPAARQTDVFADGQVQIVEFELEDGASSEIVGKRLSEARLPADSRVASIIRAGRMIPPYGTETLEIGDRVIIIGSPQAAREWSRVMARETKQVNDIVIFGAGRIGVAVARVLLDQGMSVRLIEADGERAREVAEMLHEASVLHANGTGADFMQRERIGRSQAALVAMRADERNLYAAVQAKLQGVGMTHRRRPRCFLDPCLRGGRHRRDDRSALPHSRGDRPVRARPAHAAGGDARGRPLRDPRHHLPVRQPARREAVPRAADDRRDDRRRRPRRQGDLPAR